MGNIFNHVKREILIRSTPERAWSALTDPEERNRWETRHCRIDLTVGGIVELDYGWGVSYRGKIVELIPYKKLALQNEAGEFTIWTLEEHADGTLVAIEYTGHWASEQEYMMMDNMAFGTYRFMQNMKYVLEDSKDIRSSFWTSWIGVQHYTYQDHEVSGTKVLEVIPNTSADGIIEAGDVIVQADDHCIQNYDQLEEKVTSMQPGDPTR
ncbi:MULTISPECIES: SRPBCC family protein [Paenibacillus]|uniref:SRPBCC family protein n=1 Tax=Paenibacillus TaxID=44249 RepID=UPI001FD609AF|nr:SRPBCC domain-containing protein [Paenibacillus campinasensis]